MKTTKSPLRVAQLALSIARQCYHDYSCAKSPKKFTQPQLVGCLVLKEFLRLDYRGIHQFLLDLSDVRGALGMTTVPHFTTLCAAHRRLLTKAHTSGLLDRVLDLCRRKGVLPDKTRLAMIDSTGLGLATVRTTSLSVANNTVPIQRSDIPNSRRSAIRPHTWCWA